MIIGGQAVLIYGEPRLTKDIDITLGIGTGELIKMKRVVGELKLKVLAKNIEGFVKETMVLPAIDERTGIKVDFIFSFSAYEKQAIERANNVKFGKTAVKFASLEDVVIHKIVAGRARDIEDVKSILLKNEVYDGEYVSKWLREFDKTIGKNFSGVFKKLRNEIK